MGAFIVRMRLATHMLHDDLYEPAVRWLAELEEEDRARSESSQAEQIRTARSAMRAAWIAAIAAIIAAVIAIIGIIVTVLSWLYPRH
jgi:type IV secretory pathway component VirB8